MIKTLLSIFAVFWALAEASAAVPLGNGAATVGGCSGGVVQLRGRSMSENALVITNGHCLLISNLNSRETFLKPGEVLIDRAFEADLAPVEIRVFDGVRMGETVRARRVIFATMTGTDVALIELDMTYEELRDRLGVLPFHLSDQPAPLNEKLLVYASTFSRAQSCSIESRVDLREGNYQTNRALKFDRECSIYSGFSGSPILKVEERTLFGLANTHYDADSARPDCSINKPCEIGSGESPRSGQSYGVQTEFIYKCFDITSGRFDFNRASCSFPLRAPAFESTRWSFGGTPVGPKDSLNRTLVAIGNKKSQVCSGTFVAKDVVLTAAHCVIAKPGEGIGQVGDFVYPLSLEAGYDPIRGEKLRITKVVVHPKKVDSDIWISIGENQFSFDNPDLALLQLEREYEAAVPAEIASRENARTTRGASFAGFGQGTTGWQRPDRIEFGIFQDGKSEIESQYRGVETGNTKDFITAMLEQILRIEPFFYVVRAKKPGDQTLCYGDSGGPLFTQSQGRIQILGVASLFIPHPQKGNRACGDSYLNLFAKIDPYRNWLSREIKNLSRQSPAGSRANLR